MSAHDRPPSRTPHAGQGDLFKEPPKVLTIGEVEVLFCEHLGIHRATFYDVHRQFLPFVATSFTPVAGSTDPETGRRLYREGGWRLRADYAREILQLAADGYWLDYASGALADDDEFRHLYPRKRRTPSRQAA